MTNIEYYGFKNIKFKQDDRPSAGLSFVDVFYIPKHSNKDIKLYTAVCSINDVNKIKIKWLLDEVKHTEPDFDRFSIELMYGLPYVYKMKHCKGGLKC